MVVVPSKGFGIQNYGKNINLQEHYFLK